MGYISAPIVMIYRFVINGWIYYEYYTDVEPARIGEEVDTNSYIYEVA